jgi:two-component system sensor histidine kinase TctE
MARRLGTSLATPAPRTGLAWRVILGLAAALVFAQLAWWATLFVGEVDKVVALRSQLEGSAPAAPRVAEAQRRRTMIVSETLFFAAMMAAVFSLLYRALRREEHARESQRNFLEIVTHESKTPITALKLRLEEALTSPAATEPGLQRELTLAIEEVQRLASIVDKALSLHRLEREPLVPELVDVEPLLRSLAQRLEPLCRKYGVALSVRVEASPSVFADPTGLRNAMQALVENAILHGEAEQRRVEVVLGRDGGNAFLTVRDNGPGIDENDRKQLFQRFYRGRPGGRVPGTGLGLYLARAVVEAHGGSVRWVGLGLDGAGAEFRLSLPEVRTA